MSVILYMCVELRYCIFLCTVINQSFDIHVFLSSITFERGCFICIINYVSTLWSLIFYMGMPEKITKFRRICSNTQTHINMSNQK